MAALNICAEDYCAWISDSASWH